MRNLALFAVCVSMVAGFVATHPPHDPHRNVFDYCVIGAGPGGVQAAIYFEQLGMKYVVLERSPRAGNFFHTYPRHRRLISINKRFTGKGDTEFQIRHDWNSLITNFDAGTEDVPYPLNDTWLFRPYSKVYFPNAGLIVDYLMEMVKRYDLNVRFNHTVASVVRQKSKGARFMVEFEEEGRGPVQCSVLIVATGRFVPMKFRPEQEAFVEGYEETSTRPSDFRDQRVAILGTGNAALETAEAIHQEVAYVHMASRYPVTLAWQTHYVGHARALNFGFLDRTQLKSLDTLLPGLPFDKLEFSRHPVTGRVLVKMNGTLIDGSSESSRHAGYDRVLRCVGFLWDRSIFNRTSIRAAANNDCGDATAPSEGSQCLGGVNAEYDVVAPYSEPKQRYLDIASNFESVNVPRLFVAGTLMHFRDFKKSSGGFIHGFRYLVRTMVLQMRERFERKPYPSTLHGPYTSLDLAADNMTHLILSRLANTSSLYQLPAHLSDVIVWDFDEVKKTGNDDLSFRYIPDIPLDQTKSRNPIVIGSERVRNAQMFMTVSIEFGKEFQGMGILHHNGQPEPRWRTLEKKMWDDENDADVRIRNATRGPSTFKPRRDDIEVQYAPCHPHRAPPEDVDDYTSVPETNGYNFIHPVFRVFSRKGQRVGIDMPKQIMEFGLQEDLHNEWILSRRHINPLRRFLKAALPKLLGPRVMETLKQRRAK